MTDDVQHLSEEDWQKKLTPEQYEILRKKGTERPFTGAYWDEHGDGMYHCAACDNPLFSSDTKFDSGTGWPSFDRPANIQNVLLKSDTSMGMRRTEVMCKKCGSHLGHLFDDGPTETGQRFCINSASLCLKKENKK